MEGVSFLFVFVCLGLVLAWYASNEEASADGEEGFLALRESVGKAQPGDRVKFAQRNDRAKPQRRGMPTDRVAQSSRLVERKALHDGGDAVRAGGKSDAYAVKVRGRPTGLSDIYQQRSPKLVETKSAGADDAVGKAYRTTSRGRYVDRGGPRKSRYMKVQGPPAAE